MSDSSRAILIQNNRAMLISLKSHMWIVAGCLGGGMSILTVIFVLSIRHWDLHDIKKWIQESRCNCGRSSQSGMIHDRLHGFNSHQILNSSIATNIDGLYDPTTQSQYATGFSDPGNAFERTTIQGEAQ